LEQLSFDGPLEEERRTRQLALCFIYACMHDMDGSSPPFVEWTLSIGPKNVLLASLTSEDIRWLEPRLECVDLPRGMVLSEQGRSLHHIYFPHSAVVSLIKELQNGQTAEMASFGREALVGFSFDSLPAPSFGRYMVQIPGTASRIAHDRLRDAMASRPGIRTMILRYTEILWVLSLQNVACNAVHNVEARCCRWIVATHDRVDRNDLPLTHEALAEMLGVQRSTVTEVMRGLQKKGLVRQDRGSVTVLNRSGLQEAACECYGVLREKYLQLLSRVHGKMD